jgi:diguanylate cyclase (GGDEF)-like protein
MNNEQIKVLLVEDNQVDLRFVHEMLSESRREKFVLTYVDRLQHALDLLIKEQFDVMLLNLQLPDAYGLSALIGVQALAPNLPIVVRSEVNDEQLAIDAVHSGAQDYIVKGEESSPLLMKALRYAIERKRIEQSLAYLAHYDPLTDLPNRELFRERLNRAQERTKRSGYMIALMFLDLDHFKDINDTLGHDAGDQLLKFTAQRLKHCVRTEDTIARLGGDEFTIILEQIEHKKDAAHIAQKIVDEMSKPFLLNDKDVFVTMSIGIAIYTEGDQSSEELIKHADMALYAAKAKGRSNYQFFEAKMNTLITERMAMVKNLKLALERNEFVLHYQPQVDLSINQLVGVEALLRWQHPEMGLMQPNNFIPLLEETGLIIPVGEWILHTACQQSCIWLDAGLPRIRISVNLSAKQFRQLQLANTVKKTLDETGMDPGHLHLEVTESFLLSNVAETIFILNELNDLGVHISLDDFGTGYSSLNYLHRYPFASLKIDQSFVKGVTYNSKSAAIISAIISLAHNLGLKVVAEGVEYHEQLPALLNMKCDEAQGYIFGVPLSSATCETMFKNIFKQNSKFYIRKP